MKNLEHRGLHLSAEFEVRYDTVPLVGFDKCKIIMNNKAYHVLLRALSYAIVGDPSMIGRCLSETLEYAAVYDFLQTTQEQAISESNKAL